MGEGAFRDREGNNQRRRERAGRERHKGRVVLMLAALPRTKRLHNFFFPEHKELGVKEGQRERREQ